MVGEILVYGISSIANVPVCTRGGGGLRFQTMHQRQVVPELTNELATFLTIHADDSDVENNPLQKRKY